MGELLGFLYESCQELGLIKELLKLPLGLTEQVAERLVISAWLYVWTLIFVFIFFQCFYQILIAAFNSSLIFLCIFQL